MSLGEQEEMQTGNVSLHGVPCVAKRLVIMLAAVGLLAACSSGNNTAPAAPAYTISGTVSGLTGTGLALQNNGAGSLPVPAEATTFAFTTGLPDGADYDVSVLVQPALPAQLCSVGRGLGKIAGANVVDISIVCIDKPNTPPVAYDDPQVAATTSGVAVDIPTSELLANDADIDIDSGIAPTQQLVVTLVGAPSNGTVILNNNGTPSDSSDDFVRFTPAIDFTGVASFEYTVSDGAGGTDVGLARVRVVEPDVTKPAVTSTTPAEAALAVPIDGAVLAVFSEVMNAATLDPTTFVLTDITNSAAVSGSVTVTVVSGVSRATFTPDAALLPNTLYTARVTTGAQDLAGNSLVEYVWSFTTSHWLTADLIETDNTGDAAVPQVVVDGSGNGLAVWAQLDNTGNYSIWANRYTAASDVWAAPVLVESSLGSAYAPSIAMDSNGDAIAVWQQWDGQRISIWSNRYTASSNAWGTASLREADNTGNALAPRIAFDGADNALLVWQQYDGTRFNIMASRYTDVLSGWSTPTLIETDDLGDAYYPDIAVTPAGDALAVWQQYDGTRYNIWANNYMASSELWGTALLLETTDLGSAFAPKVAMTPDGHAMVVWYQSDGALYDIWARPYTAGPGWVGDAIPIEADGGSAYYPEVAVKNQAGALEAVVVWYQSNGAYTAVRSKGYAADVWGTTVHEIGGSSAGSAYRPQVVMHAATGDATAVWAQSDGARYNIHASQYTALSAAWSAAELIESDNSGSAGVPAAGINAAGDVLAVWPQSDGVRKNIWANRRVP